MALYQNFILSDNSYLVSEWFREVFSKFNVSPHIFYPAWLKYKNQRIKCYVLIILDIILPDFTACTYKLINLPSQKSKNPFLLVDESKNVIDFETFTASQLNIEKENDFYEKSVKYYKEGKVLTIKNYFFKKQWDYFHCNVPSGNRFISGPLKQAIEEAEITGVTFLDLDDISLSFKN